MSRLELVQREALSLDEAYKLLPRDFLEYVKSKAEKNKGRPTWLSRYEKPLNTVLKICELVWLKGKTANEVANMKSINTSYRNIYRLLNDIAKWRSQLEEWIMLIKPKITLDFRSHPLIRKWEDRIRLSGSLSQLDLIPTMEWVITGKRTRSVKCKFNYPDDYEPVRDPAKFDLQEAQKFIIAFNRANNLKQAPSHIRRAIRHFLMVAREINIPRGFGKTYGLSGEKSSIGKYGHVRLTEEQIYRVDEYLFKRSLLEEDFSLKNSEGETIVSIPNIYRHVRVVFNCFLEMFPRPSSALRMPRGAIKLNEDSAEITIFERKTGDQWSKYILASFAHGKHTLQLLREYLDETDYPYPFAGSYKPLSDRHVDKLRKGINKKLKEAYRYASVTDEYFYTHPLYALRHSGAQIWLQRTNWDYALISEMGWRDISTLRLFYGRMPAQIFQKKVMTLKQTGGMI
ncbi:hypothetical protein DRO58_02520 [Candidatus Bathyarchaeota archaeon]|nr:MAG: hypothetical protein DRO58_02520 [Candidatus Bathyarchaeota archaeon]